MHTTHWKTSASALAAALLISGCFPTLPVGEGGCAKDADCKEGTVCDLESKACVRKEGTQCQADADCPADKRCDADLKVCVDRTTAACASDAECKAGEELCDLTLKLCVPIGTQPCTKECPKYHKCQRAADTTESCVRDATPCELACGDAAQFTCVVEATGEDYCVAQSTVTKTAQVASPAEGKKFRRGALPVECQVTAPMIRTVEVEIVQGGTKVTSALSDEGGGSWKTTWDASAALEGEWEAACVVKFGPLEMKDPEFRSAARKFVIDATAPRLSLTAPTKWHRRGGKADVRATIVDEGPEGLLAGVDAASVKLSGPGLAADGVLAANEYRFEVDLATAEPATVQGDVAVVVRAADLVGNAAEAGGTVKVDAVAPSVGAITAPALVRRDGGTFELAAVVTADGAPVKAVSIAANGKTFAATASQADATTWVATIDPTQLVGAGEAATVAFTVSAEDEAGNTGTKSGSVVIDGSAPTLQSQGFDTTKWYGNGNAIIEVAVADTGSGAASVKFRHGAGTPANCDGGGATRTCTVAISQIPANTETSAYPVEITATDNAGNAATPLVVNVRVDRKQPANMVAADVKTSIAGWRRRSATAFDLVITLRDAGSGIDTAVAPKLVFGSGAGAVTYSGTRTAGSANEGDWTFAVKTADLVAEKTTNGNVGANLSFQDAVGNPASGSLALKVDDQPPVIAVQAIPYASGKTNFKRNEKNITLKATITDAGAGVDAATVTMTYTGRDGNAKVATGTKGTGNEFTWNFDASDPQFNAAEGNILLSFAAKDSVGLGPVIETAQVAVTRKIWEFNSGLSAKVVGSVALAGQRLFFNLGVLGAAGENVFSLNASDGAKVWSAKASGTPNSAVVLGSTELYFAQDVGGKTFIARYAQSPTGAAPTQTWTCSSPTAGFGANPGSVALATWDLDGSPVEAVFVTGTGGKVFGVFANGAVCASKGVTISGVQTTGASVSVASTPSSGFHRLWFGGLDGKLGTATFAPGGGTFETPSTMDLGDGFVAGVSLRTSQSGVATSRVKMDELSNVPASIRVDSLPSFTSNASHAPAIASDAVIFGSDDGLLFRVPATTGFPVAMPGEPKPQIRSTPTIGSNGQMFYMTDDGILRASNPSGQQSWTFDTGGSGVTSANPTLACNGVLYVGTPDGRVLALQTDSAGLANSPWPRFQHDNRNTGNIDTPIYVNGVCQD